MSRQQICRCDATVEHDDTLQCQLSHGHEPPHWCRSNGSDYWWDAEHFRAESALDQLRRHSGDKRLSVGFTSATEGFVASATDRHIEEVAGARSLVDLEPIDPRKKTRDELIRDSEARIEDVTARLAADVETYRHAVREVVEALSSDHLPKLWSAVDYAAEVEIDLVDGAGPANTLHSEIGIPDCYTRGTPCAARHDDPDSYCRTQCPLKGY